MYNFYASDHFENKLMMTTMINSIWDFMFGTYRTSA